VKSRIRKGLIRLRSQVSREEHDRMVTLLMEP
jgi:hypothetical protein